jgi:hypothetical protein
VGVENGKIRVKPLVVYKVDRFSPGGIQGHWEETGAEFSRIGKLKDQGVEFPGWLERK